VKASPFPLGATLRLSVDGVLVLEKLFVARGFWERGLGLMGRKRIPARMGQGLLFPFCREIHTFSMRFPLDVFFLDEEGQLLSERRNVLPWRIARGPKGCRHCLETAAGTLAAERTQGRWRWEA
jgi:uncharacterized membrane protein (UPF0127 family)